MSIQYPDGRVNLPCQDSGWYAHLRYRAVELSQLPTRTISLTETVTNIGESRPVFFIPLTIHEEFPAQRILHQCQQLKRNTSGVLLTRQ